MAELLLTQNELDSYLSNIDLSDPAINSTFNAIQLLNTQNYNDLLYYLVNGKVDLSALLQIPINNASVRNVILAAEIGGDTVLARKRQYEKSVKLLPGFVAFTKEMNAAMSTYMFLSSYPSSGFVKTVEIDSTGLSSTKFNGVASVKQKYSETLATSKLGAAWSGLQEFCASRGLNRLLKIVEKELAAYEVVASSDGRSLPLRAGAKDSLCGYAIRRIHEHCYRPSYASYMEYIFRQMAGSYDSDLSRTGAPGIAAARSLNSWDRLPLAEDAQTLIYNVGLYYMVHYRFPLIYGTTHFTKQDVDDGKAKIEVYIGGAADPGFFGRLRVFLEQFISELQTKLVP